MMYTPRFPVENEKNRKMAAVQVSRKSAALLRSRSRGETACATAQGRMTIQGKKPSGNRQR